MTTTTATPRRLRTLLALSAATALLLTGCGDDPESAGVPDGPDGGQRPGAQPIDDETPSTPAAPATTPGSDEPDPTQPEDDSLDNFPLAAGWPEGPVESGSAGLELPVDEIEYPFADAVCGSPAPEPDTIEAFRGQFSDVEAFLSRQLLVFEDADAAVGYMSELSEFYDECRDTGEGDTRYPVRKLETEVGGQSFTVVQGTEYDGEPAVGMAAMQAVRVGRSILLDTTAGEGLIGSAADARELADSMSDRSGDVVDAQCIFTEASC